MGTGDLNNIKHLLKRPNFEFNNHDVSTFVHLSENDPRIHFASPAKPSGSRGGWIWPTTPFMDWKQASSASPMVADVAESFSGHAILRMGQCLDIVPEPLVL